MWCVCVCVGWVGGVLRGESGLIVFSFFFSFGTLTAIKKGAKKRH